MKDLRHLAAYHIVPGLIDREDFIEESRIPSLYAGYSLYMETTDDQMVSQWYQNTQK